MGCEDVESGKLSLRTWKEKPVVSAVPSSFVMDLWECSIREAYEAKGGRV